MVVLACVASLGPLLTGPLPPARADGDPASDVLVAAPPLFLSLDSGATFARKLALGRQLRSASRRGDPLRVAVIATRSDLGSVTSLWGHPERYAAFLGRELSLDFHGELLVVMPSGFGVARGGTPVSSPLDRLAPRRGELIIAAEQAVARLTGAAVQGTAGIAVAAAPSRTSGIAWWVTSAIALIVIALAWGASLRRRPARASGRVQGAAG